MNDQACRWVRSAENAYVTVCAEPDLSACPSGCQRPVAGPDDSCPCDGGCNLICIDGFLGPECGRTIARGECPAGFTSAVILGGPDPIVACVYMFLDAGKQCSVDGDCDATHDEELSCRDFSDGRFCSRPCDGEFREKGERSDPGTRPQQFGPLVCRDGFYRLPNDVPLPAHVE